MGLTLRLTDVRQTFVELNDEEEAEYREAAAMGDEDYFLDPYWSDMESVERTIEEE